ncbi:UNVERIFIED_CONTAM: hypothetical protein RMT77_016070 [Armadillidium vulgare]
MVKLLEKKLFDVIFSGLMMSQERTNTVEFTVPIRRFVFKIYLKRLRREVSWNLYLLPFSFNLWICIPFSIVCTAIFLWMMNSLAQRLIGDDGGDPLPFSQSLWAIISSILQQGTSLKPKSFSCQFFLTVGYLSSLILYTCYSSLLVSILTTFTPTLPFDDLEDLSEKPEWKLGIESYGLVNRSFGEAEVKSIFKILYEINVLKDSESNIEFDDLLQNALKWEKFACISRPTSVEVILGNQSQNSGLSGISLVDTGKEFMPWQLAFVTPKNSPFIEIFNHYLLKMMSSGHFRRLELKWWPKTKRLHDRGYPSPGLSEVLSVFLCYVSGIILSLICLVLENVHIKQTKRRNNIWISKATLTHRSSFEFLKQL